MHKQLHKGIDYGENRNLFNDVLACCLSQKNFLSCTFDSGRMEQHSKSSVTWKNRFRVLLVLEVAGVSGNLKRNRVWPFRD